MPITVIGTFNHLREAEGAIAELRTIGFTAGGISFVAGKGESPKPEAVPAAPESPADGAAKGAAIGGGVGLMVSLVSMALPGIGPVFAAGPVVAATAAMGIGAATGGMIGALTHMGIPSEHTEHYRDQVRQGKALISVESARPNANRVMAIMTAHGASRVNVYPEGANPTL